MKKPSVVSFLITLLLAAPVCIQGKEPVKDTAGNDLKTGKQYFIQAVNTNGGRPGGLVPASFKIQTLCPLNIVQALLPYQPGLPVSFSFPNEETTVYTDDSPNIEFQSDIWLFCNEFSKFWKVNDSSSATEEPPILIAGTPGEQNSAFKIEKTGEGAGANTYKLTTIIGPVGITNPRFPGIPTLVVTNDKAKSLVVQFKNVDDATSATTTFTSRVDKLGLRMFPFY